MYRRPGRTDRPGRRRWVGRRQVVPMMECRQTRPTSQIYKASRRNPGEIQVGESSRPSQSGRPDSARPSRLTRYQPGRSGRLDKVRLVRSDRQARWTTRWTLWVRWGCFYGCLPQRWLPQRRSTQCRSTRRRSTRRRSTRAGEQIGRVGSWSPQVTALQLDLRSRARDPQDQCACVPDRSRFVQAARVPQRPGASHVPGPANHRAPGAQGLAQ